MATTSQSNLTKSKKIADAIFGFIASLMLNILGLFFLVNLIIADNVSGLLIFYLLFMIIGLNIIISVLSYGKRKYASIGWIISFIAIVIFVSIFCLVIGRGFYPAIY